jgi:hypothetical protein
LVSPVWHGNEARTVAVRGPLKRKYPDRGSTDRSCNVHRAGGDADERARLLCEGTEGADPERTGRIEHAVVVCFGCNGCIDPRVARRAT